MRGVRMRLHRVMPLNTRHIFCGFSLKAGKATLATKEIRVSLVLRRTSRSFRDDAHAAHRILDCTVLLINRVHASPHELINGIHQFFDFLPLAVRAHHLTDA
jgi:hypothetical protein